MEHIPLHSLCIVTGKNSSDLLNNFPKYEFIDANSVMHELVGNNQTDLLPIVINEIKHKIELKLSLGERVLITSVSKEYWNTLINTASNQGASVFYLDDGCNENLDNASVVDIRTPVFPVLRLPTPSYDYLKSRWKGITVVGDIHGSLRPMLDALAWAESRQHFVWLLGDIVDYGENTIETLDMAYKLVMGGKGSCILGNHEKKIARYLANDGSRIKLSDGNKVTVDALSSLSPTEKQKWVGRFRGLLSHTSVVRNIGNIILAHAAVHKDVWTPHSANDSNIENFALHGEGDFSNSRFSRSYDWVEHIPPGKTVIVGHDARSKIPLNIVGSKGGRVIFLDTGCGKGGKLSSCDLKFSEFGLRIENFNMH